MTNIPPSERREAPARGRVRDVPFNRPYVTGAEIDYIREAIANAHISGNGPFTEKCVALLEREFGSGSVLLTHSCTGALEMAMQLAGTGPGDEVIVPSFAFPSLPNAVVLSGATPVFVDIRRDTLNLDERLLESAITPRTRAIAPIDYAGIGCEIDSVLATARARDLVVIEDAAQGYGASFAAQPIGTRADLACFSFHETKTVMCGEGGALLINRPEWVERAEIMQEKGTNRREFFRGQVDKYTWVDIGSSFVVSDLSAAFLWAQLQSAEEITARRQHVWSAYHAAFEELELAEKIQRPVVPPHCTHNAHMYYVLLAPAFDREIFIERLAQEGVRAVFHYVPLHSSPAGRRYGRAHGPLDVTDDAAQRLVRLPLWVGMTAADAEHVTRMTARVLNALG